MGERRNKQKTLLLVAAYYCFYNPIVVRPSEFRAPRLNIRGRQTFQNVTVTVENVTVTVALTVNILQSQFFFSVYNSHSFTVSRISFFIGRYSHR